MKSDLNVADGKSADKSVMFAFEPVFIDRSQQIHDVAFTQRQFSATPINQSINPDL